MLELIAIAEQIYGEEMDKETTGTGGVDVGIAPQGQSEYSDLPLSFAEYERLSYREKAERFHLPAKDYDEVKKAFDTYLNRIGYHYKYFGSYMDEIKALQKAVQDLHFEKAVENVAGQMKEQGIGAENFTRMSAEEMAEYFKGYVESMEDVTTLLLGIIKKLGVEMQFDKKYRFISEVYGEICEYKIQKSKMQKR